MQFVATTSQVTIGPGAYLRLQPEHIARRPRPYELPEDQRPVIPPFEPVPPPDMPTGSVVLLKGKPCRVIRAERSWAVLDIDGRAWLMSHMTPAEMAWHPHSYERGSMVQEWILRREVDPATFDPATDLRTSR